MMIRLCALIFIPLIVNSCEIDRIRNKRAESKSDDEEHSHYWDYEKYGPKVWEDYSATCGGAKQSPINIDSKSLEHAHFGEFTFFNYSKTLKNLNITNNGHTVQVNVDEDIYIRGGGLPSKYKLIQFHFHWGSSNKEGSENTLNGVQYPLEVHLVHIKDGVDLSEISEKSDGLAVLGILFNIDQSSLIHENLIQHSEKDFPTPLSDALEDVKVSGKKATMDDFKMEDFLPRNTGSFFRFQGSLTTPPCAEAVVWTVFADTITITEEQMNAFRRIQGRTGKSLKRNYRPVQGLNGRKVLYRSSSGEMPDQKKSTRVPVSYIIFGVIICLLLLAICLSLCFLIRKKSKKDTVNVQNDSPYSVSYGKGGGDKY